MATALTTTYLTNERQTDLLQEQIRESRLEQLRQNRLRTYRDISVGLQTLRFGELPVVACRVVRDSCRNVMDEQDRKLQRMAGALIDVEVYGSDKAVTLAKQVRADAFSIEPGRFALDDPHLVEEWAALMREELAVCREPDCSDVVR
jgi:hypothetical protein